MFDEDKSGKVDLKEMQKGLVNLGVAAVYEVQELFRAVDANGDSSISYAEFAAALKDQDRGDMVVVGDYQNKYGQGGGMADAHRREQIKALGVMDDYTKQGETVAMQDSHGKMEYYDQGGGKLAQRVRQRLDSQFRSLKDAYRMFDADRNGKIDLKELSLGLSRLNIGKREELSQLFGVVDKDGSGQLSYQEFANVLKDFDGQHESTLAGGPFSGTAPVSGRQMTKLEQGKYTDQVKLVDQEGLSEHVRSCRDIQHRIKSQFGQNATGSAVVNLFRSCEPDGCGYISKHNCMKLLVNEFGLARNEAQRLYAMGDREKTGEMDIRGFSSALIGAGEPPGPGGQLTARPTNQMTGAHYGRYGSGADNAVQTAAAQNMPLSLDREAVKVVKQVSECLREPSKKQLLSNRFHQGETGNTRMAASQARHELGAIGAEINSAKFKQLYGEQELTFSQLQKRTSMYDKQLMEEQTRHGGSIVPRGPPIESSLSIRGDYVGCRKLHRDLRPLEERTPFGNDLRDGPKEKLQETPQARRYDPQSQDLQELAWKNRLDPNNKAVVQVPHWGCLGSVSSLTSCNNAHSRGYRFPRHSNLTPRRLLGGAERR